MTLNYVQISGTFEDGTGQPLSGNVSFTPNVTVYSSGIPLLTPDSPIQAQVVAGQLRAATGGTLQLLATDNTFQFEGQTGFLYYTVSVTLGGLVLPAWSFFLPHASLGNGPVDLWSLANTPASGGGGGITPPAGDIGGSTSNPTVVSTHLAAALPIAQGGTGTATGAAQNGVFAGPASGGPGAPSFRALASGDIPSLPYDASGAAAAALTAAEAYADTNKLAKASNLSDLASAGTARTNLGLGSAATQPSSAFDASGAAASAQAASLQKSANLSDVASRQTALNTITGAQSAGKYLRSDGTNAGLAAIQPGDLGTTPGSSPNSYLPLLYGAVWGYAWQFWPESYGAKPDGKLVSDGAITNGQNVLACTGSAPFTSTAVDGGKPVIVPGAGAGGGPLLTAIASVTDSAHAVLAANAGTTVTAAGVIFGTDNTVAIKAMQAAGVTYAQGGFGRQEAEYLFSPELRVAAGAATVGGGTLGNSIFPRPVIAGTAPKLSLTFRCTDPVDVAGLPHWLQTTPQALGACLAILRLDGTLDATYGPASVFGGPLNGYGGLEGGTFNNVQTVVDGISLLLPNNPTFGGWDFYGDAECLVKNGSAFCMATVPPGTPWPQYNPNSISNQWSYALRMPSQGNNARCEVGAWSAYGFTYGFMPCEHTDGGSVRCDYNITGIEGYASGTHGGKIKYASCEGNINALGFRDGVCKLDIDILDVESNNTTIYDPQSFGNGTIGIRGVPAGYYTNVANGGLALRILLKDNEPGAVTSPQAPPATTAAWLNGYYQPAEIALSVSGGSLSALTVAGPSGAVSQPVPSGTTYYRFTLAPGGSYTPTFTGTLSHTVNLL